MSNDHNDILGREHVNMSLKTTAFIAKCLSNSVNTIFWPQQLFKKIPMFPIFQKFTFRNSHI